MEHEIHLERVLKDKIAQTLEPGEKIQWMDRPEPGFFTSKTIIMIVWGTTWIEVGLLWIYGTSGFSIPDFSAGLTEVQLLSFIGFVFIIIGLGMLLHLLWVYRKLCNSAYLITNRKAVIFEGSGFSTIHSYSPEKLQDIYYRETKNGKGDVILDLRTWKALSGFTKPKEVGFMGIRNPREIHGMLAKISE